MMNEYYGYLMPRGELFEYLNFPIIIGVTVLIVFGTSYPLKGINDYQGGIGMCLHEIMELHLKTAAEYL